MSSQQSRMKRSHSHISNTQKSRRTEHSISPPPSRRRRTNPPTNHTTEHSVTVPPPSNPSTLRIFSWNINGITPFLKSSHSPSPSNQKITNFFTSSRDTETLEEKSPNPQATKSSSSRSRDTSPIPPKPSSNYSLRAFLHHHHYPHHLLLQEVKIAAHDTKTQAVLLAKINTPLPSESPPRPSYTAHFTLPTDPHNCRGLHGSGKIYGVCSIIRSDIAALSRIRTVSWDSEGRVSIMEIFAPGFKIAVFNIYAVNGTGSVYRGAATGAVIGTRHERKREFQRLLRDECVEMEKEGWLVLVCGDMNVAVDERDGWPKLRVWPEEHVVSRAEFRRCFLDGDGEGFKGVDVWREIHGDERRYTYFPRGRPWGSSCDRVDYFIAGWRLWESGRVMGCGILDSEVERGPSDHVPIWVEIEGVLE